MPDETTVPEAGAEQTTPEAPQIDLSPIEEQITRLGSRFDAIEQHLPKPDQPDPYESVYGYADALGLQEQGDEDPQAALRALADLSRQQAQAEYQNSVNPQLESLQREVHSMRVERDLQQLKSELPDLNKPDVAEAVAGIVEEALVGLPPEARFNPQIVRLAYKTYLADKMATDEGSAGQSHQQLENPAGAGPEGSEPSWSDRLLQNHAPTKGAAFWGLRT